MPSMFPLPTRQRMSATLVFTLLILPLAQPFASGSSASSNLPPHLSSSDNNLHPHQHAAAPLQPSRPSRTKAAAAADAASIPDHDDHHSHSSKKPSRLTGLWQKVRRNKTPRTKTGEYSVSLPSRLIYRYATPLLKKAPQGLDASDAMEVPDARQMDTSVTELEDTYQNLRHKSRRTLEERKSEGKAIGYEAFLLTKALFLHQKRQLLFTGILRLTNTAIQAFPALLVARLLRLVEAGEAQPVSKALTAALTLVSVLTVKMITENQYFHNVVKMSTQVRGALAGMIFDKALRLPSGGSGVTQRDKGAMGVGGVLNLMQSDASIVESAALQLHTTWDGLLQLAVYTSLLYRFLGKSVFYGIAVLLATIPINSVTLRILNRLARYENEAKDARNKRTAESVANMKLLKLFGWEERFAEDIRGHRSDELSRHASRGIVRALNSAVSNAVPAVVLVVTLTAYAREGKPIVASTIFTAISLFNQLRFPLFFYPMLIDALANGRNAMLRIANFLAAEEITPYVEKRPPLKGGGGSIEMRNGNFLWSVSQGTDGRADEATPALADVDLEVKAGEIVAVVGSVGSGKSALIKGLLGELCPIPNTIMQAKIEGANKKNEAESDEASAVNADTSLQSPTVQPSVFTQGNIAYCSQEAWLPKGSIRDAVVFGREFDEARYIAAIRDAGLDRDIVDSFEEADPKKGQLSHDTDVGEHGAGLSGGQRARVSLARALYAGNDTQVFLLDDVLSALDANVGAMVFKRLTKRLRKQKAAVIIVTNDPSIPRRCDRVVLMGKATTTGKTSCSTVIDQGKYDELISRGRKLAVADQEQTSTDEVRPFLTGNMTDRPDYLLYSEASGNMTNGAVHSLRGASGHSSNGTEGFGYADPERQASMELCPDSCTTDLIESIRDIDHDKSITETGSEQLVDLGMTEVIAVYNDTEVSATEPVSSKETPQPVDGSENASRPTTTTLSSVDENMANGAIPISTYLSYLKSVRSPIVVLLMLGSYLMVNGAQFSQQYTLAKWSEAATGGMTAAMSAPFLRSLLNAAVVVSVFLWLRSYLLMRVGLRASNFLHSRMLRAVFRAPLSFFSATSSGTLMSRFGREMQTVDSGVPDSIGSVLFCFLQIFTSIGALAGIVTPAMLVPLTVVGMLYVKTMSIFRPAARDMKRAETKTRSPIYTHFGEALRGSATIRSIPGATRNWAREHRHLTDRNLGVFYTVKAFDRWLSTRLETLGNAVVFTAAIAAVFLTRTGALGPGSAGWGLTQALSITGLLTWAVRCLTDLETNMMSVMRVRELTDLDSEDVDLGKLSSKKSGEAPSSSTRMPRELFGGGEALQPLLPVEKVHASLAPSDSEALMKTGWPWKGNLSLNNISMRYNPSAPLVLRNVTLGVPAGTTLGIVGRTGSGKSSLLLTLFRLVEIEGGGSIEIDGVDIRSVDLKSLRRSLAIIPQDPTLFQGDIAYNLDATGASTEADMWEALEAASPTLAARFRRGDGLSTAVSEGGNNLSSGQRQLVCLARALLRKSKILVLDEATSSVDSETDREVQETIRREFVDKGVTVMTVAHRLDTVLGYDKIAVLGAGRLVEYGTPEELLKAPNGELRKLVEADRRNKASGSKQTTESAPSTPEGKARISV